MGNETGWLIENGKQGDELRYRTMRHGLPEWTSDHLEAMRFARRVDAERFAEDDEDAWRIVEHAWMDMPNYRWDNDPSKREWCEYRRVDDTNRIVATVRQAFGTRGEWEYGAHRYLSQDDATLACEMDYPTKTANA